MILRDFGSVVVEQPALVGFCGARGTSVELNAQDFAALATLPQEELREWLMHTMCRFRPPSKSK